MLVDELGTVLFILISMHVHAFEAVHFNDHLGTICVAIDVVIFIIVQLKLLVDTLKLLLESIAKVGHFSRAADKHPILEQLGPVALVAVLDGARHELPKRQLTFLLSELLVE